MVSPKAARGARSLRLLLSFWLSPRPPALPRRPCLCNALAPCHPASRPPTPPPPRPPPLLPLAPTPPAPRCTPTHPPPLPPPPHHQVKGVTPYVIHWTWTYGGTAGKRSRMRDSGLWYDTPAYYSEGNFVTVDLKVPEVGFLGGVWGRWVGARGGLVGWVGGWGCSVHAPCLCAPRSPHTRPLPSPPPARLQTPPGFNEWHENEDMIAFHLEAMQVRLCGMRVRVHAAAAAAAARWQRKCFPWLRVRPPACTRHPPPTHAHTTPHAPPHPCTPCSQSTTAGPAGAGRHRHGARRGGGAHVRPPRLCVLVREDLVLCRPLQGGGLAGHAAARALVSACGRGWCVWVLCGWV